MPLQWKHVLDDGLFHMVVIMKMRLLPHGVLLLL